MRRDQERDDPGSCLNKAKADEPVFVLRAKDPLAPFAVRSWATAAEQTGMHEPEKIAEARRRADEMDRYREANYPAAGLPPSDPRA